MSKTTLEFVLNAMYIAITSAGLNDHQRALANDTLFVCADLDCAPALAPEILRRIACNAVNEQTVGQLHRNAALKSLLAGLLNDQTPNPPRVWQQ